MEWSRSRPRGRIWQRHGKPVNAFRNKGWCEAVNPARASSIVERLLAAALAHMRSIPRRVLAACPIHVTKHCAHAVRRNVRVLLRQGHAVRGPVVAGVINPVGESPPRESPNPSRCHAHCQESPCLLHPARSRAGYYCGRVAGRHADRRRCWRSIDFWRCTRVRNRCRCSRGQQRRPKRCDEVPAIEFDPPLPFPGMTNTLSSLG